MNPQEEQLARIEQKLDAVFASTEKTRKYILWMLIGSILMVLLPILIAALILPSLVSQMNDLGALYGM